MRVAFIYLPAYKMAKKKNEKPMWTNEINKQISKLEDKSEISDGSHTFNELYRHRHALFIQLVNNTGGWRWVKSYLHHDMTSYDWYFIVMWYVDGNFAGKNQVSYHLPVEYRRKLDCTEVAKAPEWDGHTSEDVIERLLK